MRQRRYDVDAALITTTAIEQRPRSASWVGLVETRRVPVGGRRRGEIFRATPISRRRCGGGL